MKKKICVAIGMVMMIGCMTACGAAAEDTGAPVKEEIAAGDTTVTVSVSEYETYEFDTYDGEHVVIDGINIVSQDADENPLESTKVPADAEVIAPGRDYVYLADNDYYYVEDAVNNLVTVATKGMSDMGMTDVIEDEVFENDDYSFAYTPGTFEVNEARGSVMVTYCNPEVQSAGSNEIIITKEEGCTVDDIITAIVGDDSMDNVSDGSLGADMIPVKSYVRTSESPADASLTLYDQCMVLQDGGDVITVEIIRTVGQADEIDMPIEGAFTHTLESFVLK